MAEPSDSERFSRPLRWTTTLAVTVALTAASSRARADLLYFKGGGRVEAPATVEQGRVTVTTPSRTYQFREQDFVKIVPRPDPARDWPARRDAALKGPASAMLDAAWWALCQGLVAESCGMIQAAHRAGPGDPLAARLAATLDRLRAPAAERDTTALVAAIGETFDESRGPHVVLLHRCGADEAKRRLALLEQVVTAYYLWFGFLGVELVTPPQRLVSVHLNDPGRYLRFLETQGAAAFRGTQGYYHPTFRAVVTRDTKSLPRWVSLRARLEAPVSGRSDALATRRDRADLLWQDAYDAHDLGTAAHETVHLLIEASGLAPDPAQFPYWLHEGLAAQFEVVRGGRWAGVGRANDLRLVDWRSAPLPHRLTPLVRDAAFGKGYSGSLYAESWALVRHLQRARPAAFASLLERLKTPDRLKQEPPADRFLNLFREAIGSDIEAIQRGWIQDTTSLLTPLEADAPGRSTPPAFDAHRD